MNNIEIKKITHEVTFKEPNRRQLKKSYKKKLKEVQKYYKTNCFTDRTNPDWIKEWKPFIKKDHWWDWSFILDIIMYKLELTKLGHEFFSNTVEETQKEIIDNIDKCITGFKEWKDKEYSQEAMDFCNEHTIHYVVFYKGGLKDPEIILKAPTVSEMWICAPLEELYDVKKYCTENNLKPKEFVKTDHYYTSEWDDEKNQELWREMMIKATKQEQKDLEKWFLYLGEHLREWWD